MTTRAVDILIFAEDPGAANYVANLPDRLRARGWSVRLCTSGVATNYLSARGLTVDPLQSGCNFDDLITQLAPGLVLTGTAQSPDALGLSLIEAAKSMDIPVIGVIDASTGLDERFRGQNDNALQHCPQLVVVPDNAGRDGLLALGLSANRILVAGHPHWDYVRSKGIEMQSLDRAYLRRSLFGDPLRDRAVLVFGAEIYDGINPGMVRYSNEYSLMGDGTSQDRTEIVIEELLRALASRRGYIYLVLRLHPKNRREDFFSFHEAFDTVSAESSALELLYAADALVGMTSMLMIEAALLMKPTLSILPRASETCWLPTIAAGITPCALDRQSVAEQVASLIARPKQPDPVALNRLFPSGALDMIVGAVEACIGKRK